MPGLLDYMRELHRLPAEILIEPELKQHRQALDVKIREDGDLAAGAVLQAVIKPGDGALRPAAGDLVYLHVSISNTEDELLWSSRADQGGSGQPLAVVLDKEMTQGQVVALKVLPSYGFCHPSCRLPPPPGVEPDQQLCCELELLRLVASERARVCGEQHDAIKQVLHEGSSWEAARPPWEVTCHVTLRCLAHDGVPRSGRLLFSTAHDTTAAGNGSGAQPAGMPLTLGLGQGLLPPGVEDALGQMCRGERALYILPTTALQPPSPPTLVDPESTSQSVLPHSPCLLPAPPAKSLQLEVELELLEVMQVRDMTGNGEVTKRRLRDGCGEFPIDCPLHDTSPRSGAEVVQRGGPPTGARGSEGEGLPQDLTARPLPEAGQELTQQQVEGQEVDEGKPLEVDTGCGEAPEALEMSVKLMVPGELALVKVYNPRYAYAGRADCPPGLDPAAPVEFEVELVDFEREGHWQVLSMAERFLLVERAKAKANSLVKAGRYQYAQARYDRLLKLMESTRDFETQEEVDTMDRLKVAILSNMALCALNLDELGEAVKLCDRALAIDETNSKVVFRKGRALSLKGDYEAAEAELCRAEQLDNSCAGDVAKELLANKQRCRAANLKQRQEMKMFRRKA
ncbi:hypothetical protein V8C86DRAFT_765815 [Haematococcus lacustris]